MADLDRMVAGLRCRDVLERLGDYVDGELPADEVARVDEHLAGCDHCERFGGAYGSVVAALRRRPAEPRGPAEVRDRVAERLEGIWAQEGGRG